MEVSPCREGKEAGSPCKVGRGKNSKLFAIISTHPNWTSFSWTNIMRHSCRVGIGPYFADWYPLGTPIASYQRQVGSVGRNASWNRRRGGTDKTAEISCQYTCLDQYFPSRIPKMARLPTDCNDVDGVRDSVMTITGAGSCNKKAVKLLCMMELLAYLCI